MFKGVSSKLRKMSSKSVSKGPGPVLPSSEEDVTSSWDVLESEIIGREKFNPIRGPHSRATGSSRSSTRGRDGNKAKTREATEVVEEDEDFVEADDADLKDEILIIMREAMFDHYSLGTSNPPSVVLHFPSVSSPPLAKSMSIKYGLTKPYSFRAPSLKKRICFPRDGEVGEYCAFFALDLCFPLDKYVESLLVYYELPLC